MKNITHTDIYELTPNDSRKSFYGKAKVILTADGTKYLKSYDTICCAVDANGKVHRFEHLDSATTRRHLIAFLPISNKEYFALPCEKKPVVSISL